MVTFVLISGSTGRESPEIRWVEVGLAAAAVVEASPSPPADRRGARNLSRKGVALASSNVQVVLQQTVFFLTSPHVLLGKPLALFLLTLEHVVCGPQGPPR